MIGIGRVFLHPKILHLVSARIKADPARVRTPIVTYQYERTSLKSAFNQMMQSRVHVPLDRVYKMLGQLCMRRTCYMTHARSFVIKM
jgi:hypothetical protein